MKVINTIFMGTPDICESALELLKNHSNINLDLVISMPDRPRGRGKKTSSPYVAQFAKKYDIQFIQTTNVNKCQQYLDYISDHQIDLIIVFAFSQFLSQNILSQPKIGCFNIHTSLLPKYRGAAPIQYAILNDDQTTGVSIQKMVKKMDAGDIVKSSECKIEHNDNSELLYAKLKKLSSITLNEFISDVINEEISFSTQDEKFVSFAPIINKSDGFINFQTENTHTIINKTRAFSGWPGTYIYLNNKRVKVFEVQLDQTQLSAGSISTRIGTLIIGCCDGSIRISKLQIEGKKICSDCEFLNGIKNNTNKVVELTSSPERTKK